MSCRCVFTCENITTGEAHTGDVTRSAFLWFRSISSVWRNDYQLLDHRGTFYLYTMLNNKHYCFSNRQHGSDWIIIKLVCLQFSSNSPPQNFNISLTTACGYTVRRTTKMSEQANRKSIATYTNDTTFYPIHILHPLYLQNVHVWNSDACRPWLSQTTVCSYTVRRIAKMSDWTSEQYDRLSQQQLGFLLCLFVPLFWWIKKFNIASCSKRKRTRKHLPSVFPPSMPLKHTQRTTISVQTLQTKRKYNLKRQL